MGIRLARDIPRLRVHKLLLTPRQPRSLRLGQERRCIRAFCQFPVRHAPPPPSSSLACEFEDFPAVARDDGHVPCVVDAPGDEAYACDGEETVEDLTRPRKGFG